MPVNGSFFFEAPRSAAPGQHLGQHPANFDFFASKDLCHA
jgi:hypothetical protein